MQHHRPHQHHHYQHHQPAGISKFPPPPFSPSIPDQSFRLKTQLLNLWWMIKMFTCLLVPIKNHRKNLIILKIKDDRPILSHWKLTAVKQRRVQRVQESIIDDFSRWHDIRQIFYFIIISSKSHDRRTNPSSDHNCHLNFQPRKVLHSIDLT